MQLVKISAQEFERWQPSLRVISHSHPRRFASLHVGDMSIALSWQSDLVEPTMLRWKGATWVGIDQRVACVTDQGEIVFSLGLGSRLLDLKPVSAYLVIMCDDTLLSVNEDHSIRAIHRLGDIPSDVAFLDGRLVVTTADGATQLLDT